MSKVNHLLEVGADPWIMDTMAECIRLQYYSDPHDDKVYDTFCSCGYVLKCEPSGQLSSFVNSCKVQNVPNLEMLNTRCQTFIDVC